MVGKYSVFLCVVVVASCCGVVALGADGVSVKEVERNGVKGLEAKFVIAQPRDVVFETLNDLDSFKSLFPNILDLKVVRTDGDTRDVFFRVDAVLSDAEYTLRRKAERGALAHTITWRRLSGDANVIRGSWVLLDGREQGTTRVIYSSFVDVSAVVPTAMVRSVAIGKVHEMVDRVRRACAQRASAER